MDLRNFLNAYIIQRHKAGAKKWSVILSSLEQFIQEKYVWEKPHILATSQMFL